MAAQTLVGLCSSWAFPVSLSALHRWDISLAITGHELQDTLVSLQHRDRYCDAIAARKINAMNTSASTNKTARATGFEGLRRFTAGALLATAIAVGFAAASHADPGAPAPNPAIAPAPAAPWAPMIDPGCRRQLFYFNGRVHCG
ncbi:hypothetical protein [Mycobacterium sp.]|uniref:hypothetical protein n=1 Tax=Mycobacterium sp. TaxID=1785 RepID=UPI002C761829|nr:hypothetical protein [Mycobacterium sp.]HTQ16601.1 hypothetical protein [Mycobacterium sp.]